MISLHTCFTHQTEHLSNFYVFGRFKRSMGGKFPIRGENGGTRGVQVVTKDTFLEVSMHSRNDGIRVLLVIGTAL